LQNVERILHSTFVKPVTNSRMFHSPVPLMLAVATIQQDLTSSHVELQMLQQRNKCLVVKL